MAWRMFHELDAFREPCLALLGRDPAEHTLPLGLVEQLREGLGWSDQPPVFGLHVEDEAVTGAVLMTPPHNLVLAEVPAGSAAGLVEALVAADAVVPGCYGTPEASDEFMAAWCRGTGAAVVEAGERRLYVLRTLTPPAPPAPGSGRLATTSDLELVAAWFEDFERETYGRPHAGDRARARARERARIEAGAIWLWEDGSRVVSLAGTQPAVAGVARVGPVYTPPAERRRGYGSAVTAACTAAALAAGAEQVVLFTDLANPTSNAIYQRLGYRPVSDRREVRFGPAGGRPPAGSFAAVSALEARAPGRFAAEISENWTIAGKPNGGYLLAMLGRAAAMVGEHPHPVTASALYLRSPSPGPATVEAEVLRAGRSATHVRVRLGQDGAPCVEGLVTTAVLEDADPHWVGELPAMGEAAFEECVRLAPQTPGGERVALMEHAEVRLDPGSTGFLSGRPSGRGELRGWLALPHGEPFDPFSLLLAVDAFPPATFDVEHAGWVPTLELTGYVRALPAPGPVRVLVRAQLVAGRRVDESCFVWDRNGRLVAHSNQLAGIRLG